MMKLPIQAQPIVRKVRTALTIGGGMVLSQNGETECFRYCLKKYQCVMHAKEIAAFQNV